MVGQKQILSLLAAVLSSALASASDIIMATSEDIIEFDQALSRQALPPNLEPQGDEKSSKQQLASNHSSGLRENFEKDVRRPRGTIKPDRLGPPKRPPLGPRREQGRRQDLLGPPPPKPPPGP